MHRAKKRFWNGRPVISDTDFASRIYLREDNTYAQEDIYKILSMFAKEMRTAISRGESFYLNGVLKAKGVRRKVRGRWKTPGETRIYYYFRIPLMLNREVLQNTRSMELKEERIS